MRSSDRQASLRHYNMLPEHGDRNGRNLNMLNSAINSQFYHPQKICDGEELLKVVQFRDKLCE